MSEERRRTLIVMRLWREAAADKPFAPLRVIGGRAFAALRPLCFVLRLDRDPVVIDCGAGFPAPPPEMTVGSRLADVPPDCLLARAAADWRVVAERCVPAHRGGGFPLQRNREIWWRGVLLPMSGDGVTVDHLLGAATLRLDQR